MSVSGVGKLTVSLDGGPPLQVDRWEFRPPPVAYVRSSGALRPDPDWSEEDDRGHLHRWGDNHTLPTLRPSLAYVPCDASCGDPGCEGYSITRWHCAACGDPVSPGYGPDYVARTMGIPIQTGPREATLLVSDPPPGLYPDRTEFEASMHEVVIHGADHEYTGRGFFANWERSSSHGLRGELTVTLAEDAR